MRMPALAVVGPDHQIVRSTEAFRRKYELAAAECERSPELDLVLTGKTNAAVVHAGGFSVAIEAVTDAAGERQAVLTLPPDDGPSDAETAMSALREAADESGAMVWVKDLDGRYLYANPRFEALLETSGEKLRGKTDAELPRAETVDGPRLNYARDGLQEPLQLEYIVPAFEGRPPMAAFRFPLRDEDGHPIGTCGVAADHAEAQVAREEAVRLMELERWSRLDPLALRAELLEQWRVQTAAGQDASGGPLLPAFDVRRKRGQGVASRRDAEPRLELRATPNQQPQPAQSQPAEAVDAGVPDDPAPHEVEAAPDQVEPAAESEVEAEAAEGFPGAADAPAADLQLARQWAERADQLQSELQEARTLLRQAQGKLDAAQAEARRAGDELAQARSEAEEARGQAEEARGQAAEARAELEAARAEIESLKDPAEATIQLSGELERVLAAERERGDELAEMLAGIRARLADLDSALEPAHAVRR